MGHGAQPEKASCWTGPLEKAFGRQGGNQSLHGAFMISKRFDYFFDTPLTLGGSKKFDYIEGLHQRFDAVIRAMLRRHAVPRYTGFVLRINDSDYAFSCPKVNSALGTPPVFAIRPYPVYIFDQSLATRRMTNGAG
jgi:hypothetical protein